MLERDSCGSGVAAINIPFPLRLQFRIKGKRELKAILAELDSHNEDIKAMTEELRKIVRWNLEISASQMSNIDPSPTAGHITPPNIDPTCPIPSIENSSLGAPPVGAILPPVGVTLPLASATPPPVNASMPPRAGGTTAIDNPPRPPSLASSGHGINTYGREFHSSDSFTSYEWQDNYSTHTGDKICTQCHQVWRRD